MGIKHFNIDVYGPGIMSKLRGPVLLQRPIPGITLTHPDGFIEQIVIGGNILDYRRKLYHDVNISINGDVLEKGYHAWRMEDTYAALWENYSDRIRQEHVSPESLEGLAQEYGLVINTAPAREFCTDSSHIFVGKTVLLTWDTQIEDQRLNTIYFNADESVPWVRSSNVFGNVVTEWPEEVAPLGAHPIYKPISTTCDCHPNVLRTGRFGSWRNETWVDTAYYATREALL